jgi:hypothetical protein
MNPGARKNERYENDPFEIPGGERMGDRIELQK